MSDHSQILDAIRLLETRIDARFNTIDARLNNIDLRLSNVENRLANLEHLVRKIERCLPSPVENLEFEERLPKRQKVKPQTV